MKSAHGNKEHLNRENNHFLQAEPFPCEFCGLVFTNFHLLQEHVASYHRSSIENCKLCSLEFGTKDEWEEHMAQEHEDKIVLHSMAKQVDYLAYRCGKAESFNNELVSVIRKLCENTEVIKKDLISIHNKLDPEAGKIPSKDNANVMKAPFVAAPPSKITNTEDTNKKNIKQKSRYQLKPRILVVGDSLLQNSNFRHVEKVTQSTIKSAKGYSSAVGNNDDFKHPNITDVTKNELEKAHYNQLILAAPTVDISNIVTKGLKPGDDTEHMKVKVRESCLNMFTVAEHALDKHKLEKVVIFNHAPRHDTIHEDPVKIKHNLALFANAHMRELWLSSPYKHRIAIGEHAREDKSGGRYNGYHYTKSILNILSSSFHDPGQMQTMTKRPMYSTDHTNCPQAKYMRLYSSVVSGQAVKTQNRFSPLNTLSEN